MISIFFKFNSPFNFTWYISIVKITATNKRNRCIALGTSVSMLDYHCIIIVSITSQNFENIDVAYIENPNKEQVWKKKMKM